MRDNGLLLELELLKDIGLKSCLDLCDSKLVDIDLGEISIWRQLTEGHEVVNAEYYGDKKSPRSPFLLNDKSANDEEQARGVDIIDVVPREERVVVAIRRHGGALLWRPPRLETNWEVKLCLFVVLLSAEQLYFANELV